MSDHKIPFRNLLTGSTLLRSSVASSCLVLFLPISIPVQVFAAEPDRVEIVHLGESRVAVNYRLATPQSKISFHLPAPEIRVQYWRPTESQANLTADQFTYSAPVRSMRVVLLPDERPIDRVYPSLFSLDRATAVVNLDYIRARARNGEPSIELRNALDRIGGQCVATYIVDPEVGGDLPEATGRYVLLSSDLATCERYAADAADGLIVGQEVSETLGVLLSQALQPIYRSLKARLGIPVGPDPIFIISQNRAATRSEYQADVGWQSVISIRFQGDGWDATGNAIWQSRILISLAHELVHVWIGRQIRTDRTESAKRAWLHEGAAEYLALVEVMELGYVGRFDFLTRLGERVSACATEIDEQYLMTNSAPSRGQLIYDCGTAVQLIYDAAIRSKTEGESTLSDVWRAFLARAESDGRSTISAADFLDASSKGKAVASRLLYGPGIDLTAFAQELKTVGIQASVRKSDAVATIASAVLMPFLFADCEEGPFGFWTNSDHFAIDANSTCGAIPAGFVVRYVAGKDLLEEPSAAYDALVNNCTKDEFSKVAGRTVEEPVLTLPCPEELPPHPLALEIQDVPFLTVR